MDTFEGRSLSSIAFAYPADVTSETGRKKHKHKVLREFPETLKADLCVLNDKVIQADLLFYTEHPNAWHTALCSANKQLKMAGNKAMRQLYLDTVPKFNVNIYNNGTVMIQGSEDSLKDFELDFTNLKSLAEREKKSLPQTAASDSEPRPSAHGELARPPASCAPPFPSSPKTGTAPQSPRTPVSVQRIQDCLSLLEVEVTELKENKLHDNDNIQQLIDELRLFKEETRLILTELGDNMDALRKENSALHDTLSRVKMELEQRERDIRNLSQQLLSLTTTAAEQPQSHTTGSETDSNQADPETSQAPGPTVPQPDTQPVPQPSPAPGPTVPQPDTQPAPQPSPARPPHTQPPKTAILIDSNGKFLHHRKLFPRHKVAKFWCPTTEKAFQLLCQSSLDNPDNIIIHTGTNDLRSKGEGVSEAVRKIAEKAHRVFPEANIIISTLLPRTDFPRQMISKINHKIIKDCAPMTNISIAHHPALTHEHLFDGLHLHQDSVRIFAKSIKDAALSRGPPTHHSSRGSPHQLHQGRLDTCHPPRETRAQPGTTHPRGAQPRGARPKTTWPSGALPSGARPGTTQPNGARHSGAHSSGARTSTTQPSGAHPSSPSYSSPQQSGASHGGAEFMPPTQHQLTYAEVVQHGKQYPNYSDMGEVRQLLQLICRIIG